MIALNKYEELLDSAGTVPFKTHEDAFNFAVKFLEQQLHRRELKAPRGREFTFCDDKAYVAISLGSFDEDGSAKICFTKFNGSEIKYSYEFYPNEAEAYILKHKEQILSSLKNCIECNGNTVRSEDKKVMILPKEISVRSINIAVAKYYFGKGLTQVELLNRMYAMKSILMKGYYLYDTIQILENRERWFDRDCEANREIKKNVKKDIQYLLGQWGLKLTKHGLYYK